MAETFSETYSEGTTRGWLPSSRWQSPNQWIDVTVTNNTDEDIEASILRFRRPVPFDPRRSIVVPDRPWGMVGNRLMEGKQTRVSANGGSETIGTVAGSYYYQVFIELLAGAGSFTEPGDGAVEVTFNPQ